MYLNNSCKHRTTALHLTSISKLLCSIACFFPFEPNLVLIAGDLDYKCETDD